MSADNGIYILESKSSAGKNIYRVGHFMAIENMEWYTDTDGGSYRARTEEEKRLAASQYWKDVKPVFESKSFALAHAAQIEEEIANSDFPVLEYGISLIRVPFCLEGD